MSDDDSDEKPQRSYRDSATKSTNFYSSARHENNDRDRHGLGVSGSKYGSSSSSYREPNKFNSDSDDDRPSYRKKDKDNKDEPYAYNSSSSSRYGTSSISRRPTTNRSDDSDDSEKYGNGRRSNAFSSRPSSSFQRKESFGDLDSYDSANVYKLFLMIVKL